MTIRTNQEIAIQAAGVVAGHTDTMNKSFKVSEQLFKLVSLISELFPATAGLTAGSALLSDQFKNAKTVMNAFNVLERFPDWGIKENREKILSRFEKAVSRICLFVAQIFETVLFIDKCTLRFFYQAALTIGKLPIVEGVKNVFYLGSAVFGLQVSVQDLAGACSKIEKAKSKQRKWENFDCAKSVEVNFLKDKYKGKLKAIGVKENRLISEIHNLENSIKDKDALLPTVAKSEQSRLRSEIKADLALLHSKKTQLVAFNKYNAFIGEIKKGRVKSIKEYKIEKHQVRERNDRLDRTKSWIAIAAEIGKIVMIALGLLISATCLIYPVLTATAAAIIVTSLSLTSNAIGLSKNIYGFVGPKQEELPVFKPSHLQVA